MANSSPPKAWRISKSSATKIAFLTFLFYCWEGVPAVVVGLPPYVGRYFVAALILLGVGIYCLNLLRGKYKTSKFELTALGLFLVCMVVSVISNNFIYNQPVSEWLYATYIVFPLLLVFALRVLAIKPNEVVATFLVVGISVSVLLILDQLLRFQFLEIYQRSATADISLRRVVVLKTETAFAAMILITRLFSRRNFSSFIATAAALAPVAYNLFIISESRLAISATLLAILISYIFLEKGRRRFFVLVSSGLLFLAVVPFFAEKYVAQYISSSNYAADDSSISFRVIELAHFYGYFQETYGLGFGIMSVGADKNNILAFSANQGGYLYGTADYGLGVVDLGIFGALFQFGYLGLLIVIYMSLILSVRLIRVGRANSSFKDAGVLGAGVIAFVLSPWPMNFFTLEWTVMTGGFLWYLCAEIGRITSPRQRSRTHALVRAPILFAAGR